MLPQTILHSQSNQTSICLLSHATVWPIGRREAHRTRHQREKDEAKCGTVVRMSNVWFRVEQDGEIVWACCIETNLINKLVYIYIYIMHKYIYIWMSCIYIYYTYTCSISCEVGKSGGRVNSLDNNITPKAPLPMLTLALFLLVCNPTVGLLDQSLNLHNK